MPGASREEARQRAGILQYRPEIAVSMSVQTTNTGHLAWEATRWDTLPRNTPSLSLLVPLVPTTIRSASLSWANFTITLDGRPAFTNPRTLVAPCSLANSLAWLTTSLA